VIINDLIILLFVSYVFVSYVYCLLSLAIGVVFWVVSVIGHLAVDSAR
jgi:hypothetical protein